MRGFHHHWVCFLDFKKKSHKIREKSNVENLFQPKEKKEPNLQFVRLAQESENQICYKKWVKNQTSGNGLLRRIDVVGYGNAIKKEGRKEGKRKRIHVGYSNAGGKEEEEEGVVGWSFTHIMGVA
jgi:hypothetical protein